MQHAPPCSAPTCWWQMLASRQLLHWELQLGTYIICGFYLFIYLSSQLCCPLRFQNSPQTHQWEGFLVFGNFSFTTPSPGGVSIPNSFFSLFVFHILSYLLSKRMDCLSGCLVSTASTQKLFCGSCSAFKWSFDEFVGEKVVSPILFLVLNVIFTSFDPYYFSCWVYASIFILTRFTCFSYICVYIYIK